jgi:hypothetical protein
MSNDPSPPSPSLTAAAAQLSPEIWSHRVAVATEEARRLEVALARHRAGEGRGEVLRALFPERPVRTMLTRLRRYESGGRDALIDTRAPKGKERKITPEVLGALRGLVYAQGRTASHQLVEDLEKATGARLAASTVREALRGMDLSLPRGRPHGSRAKPPEEEAAEVTPLPLAGAELLLAVEDQLGAVRDLTLAAEAYLELLPAPEGEVLDDRGNRDERGHFLPEYNVAKTRTEPELGGKFDSVERRRGEKDLREMRVANSTWAARYRKDLALTLLPIVVDTPRWSMLRHWQGAHLGELCGFPYQPATLDKHVRELKLAGTAEPLREASATFWMGMEPPAQDGALIAYIDASTKPIWTHAFTRCTKVSGTGRVMPATTTVWLNSGSGTPLVYRSFSGQVSVPRQVSGFLASLEEASGSGTVQRLVILDRESHAVWLFKELETAGWQFVVPLRGSVTGPNARFEELGDWVPFNDAGDEVQEGFLWLNDSRAGEPALRQRVVARRRHRTGKVAWYATNTDPTEFDASAVITVYFARWPLQEHVFRAGNGRVGLNVHHGYGKKKVTNVGVVSELEKLDGRLRALAVKQEALEVEAIELASQQQHQHQAVARVETLVETLGQEVDARVAQGETDSEPFRGAYERLRSWLRWLPDAREKASALDERNRVNQKKLADLHASQERARALQEKRAGQTRIFTVDMELDEIMTAYKMTFMNLATHLMTHHLGVRMELDTLIRGVLTLPGERVRTATTETIRIYRQPRDTQATAAVERACETLTALGLSRRDGKTVRSLRFELVGPAPPAGS